MLREAKVGGKKAMDALEMVARCITFLPTVHRLVDFLFVRAGVPNDKIRHVVSEGLRRVVVGLGKNDTVKPDALLIYVHALLEGWGEAGNKQQQQHVTATEEARNEYASRLLYNPGTHLTGLSQASHNNITTTPPLIREFALDLLLTSIRQEVIRPALHVHMIRPLFPALLAALQSRSNRAQTLALRVVTQLVTGWQGVFTKAQWEQITTQLFGLLKAHATQDKGEVAVAVHKTLVKAIMHQKIDLTPEQLGVVVLQLRVDLQDNARRGSALQVLKVLVVR
jgi:hypothetical protein